MNFMNSNCSIFLEKRYLQEQVKKVFCYQKLSWPFTVWTNCSSDLKNFANSWPSAWNFKSFSPSLEQFLLKRSQNNFGNKIPYLMALLHLATFKSLPCVKITSTAMQVGLEYIYKTAFTRYKWYFTDFWYRVIIFRSPFCLDFIKELVWKVDSTTEKFFDWCVGLSEITNYLKIKQNFKTRIAISFDVCDGVPLKIRVKSAALILRS